MSPTITTISTITKTSSTPSPITTTSPISSASASASSPPSPTTPTSPHSPSHPLIHLNLNLNLASLTRRLSRSTSSPGPDSASAPKRSGEGAARSKSRRRAITLIPTLRMATSRDARDEGFEEVNYEWVARLVAFDELPASSSQLTHSFSFFGLFRSSPSLALPPDKLLHPVLSLTHDSTLDAQVGALVDMRTYIHQLSRSLGLAHGSLHPSQHAPGASASTSASRGEKPRRGNDLRGVEGKIAALLSAYMHAGYAACGLSWDIPPGKEATTRLIRRSVRQGFDSLLLIHEHLLSSGDPGVQAAIKDLHDNILASPFAPLSKHYFATTIFGRARQMVSNLQQASRSSVISKARLSNSAPGLKEKGQGQVKSGVMPCQELSVDQYEAMERLNLLQGYARFVRNIGSLPGLQSSQPAGPNNPAQAPSARALAREKKERQAVLDADASRASRVAFEADILRADLGLSMATAHIKSVKRRAGVSDETQVEGLDENGVEVCKKEKEVMKEGAIRWEGLAEDALIECMRTARRLVEEGKTGVLSDEVKREDWVDDEAQPAERPSPCSVFVEDFGSTGRGHSGKKTLNQAGEGKDDQDGETKGEEGHESKENESEVNSDSDSDLGESEFESSDEDEDSLSHPSPLRTLFRLYDRFEEQRLAVWLALPAERREKMSVYMRGSGGRAGDAWDALGLVLLMQYDGESLLAYGLNVEKLDKWTELASSKNAKKIRARARKKAAAAATMT